MTFSSYKVYGNVRYGTGRPKTTIGALPVTTTISNVTIRYDTYLVDPQFNVFRGLVAMIRCSSLYSW